ncbi:hypothetical protein ACQ27_gp159 [Klebsiella phage K64-1]|nr:hypothetical protein ACQ27_gp159 [Klebsiella phage K64-1]
MLGIDSYHFHKYYIGFSIKYL